jgi:predicted Zn-dependent protease with MMP-like domain
VADTDTDTDTETPTSNDEGDERDERNDRDDRDELDQRSGAEADYYAILGVAHDDAHETIHQAYRRLAKLWHPDRYTFAPDPLRERAERRMRAISRAWAELGDPIRRHAYDQRRYSSYGSSGSYRSSWMGVTPDYGSVYHASGRPEPGAANGAGMFVGMLCVILALPLLINLLNGAFHETWQVLLAGVLLIGLAALAGLFFTGDSSLAKFATAWAEGEPRGYYEQPVAAQQATARATNATNTADEEEDEDAEAAREFERLVEQALATIPDNFKPFMRNVLVRVEREPTPEDLRRMEVGPGGTLLGLYTGVPLTAQGAQEAGPEIVTIYRDPIERYCHGDPERIRDQVRRTVLHEVAHHFGIDHDEMPDWVK